MVRFFTKAFQALDSDSGGTLFNIDGDLITPRNERVRLVMTDALNGISAPFVAIYPDISPRDLSEIAKRYANANILVQAFRTDDVKYPVSQRVNYVTEHLGMLIAALYLRTQGYMIGSDSYGTVDDVVAWKSPLLNRLQNHGLIDRGCTRSELASLRWLSVLGTLSNPSSATNSELVLVEVERSMPDGLSNTETKGLNQLYKALREDVATGLYICFPLTGQGNDTPSSVRAAIDAKWRGKSKMGSILFDDNGLYVHRPDESAGAQRDSEIERLERQLRETILANFNFGEVLEFARKLNIGIDDRSFEDVSRNLKREIADRADITLILDSLKQIISKES